VKLYALVGDLKSGYLHRDPREVRRLVEAVALARGAPSPAEAVPADWVPTMRAVAASRAAGKSWRDAPTEAGLEAPDDLSGQAKSVRAELSELWNQLLPVVGLTLESLSSVARDQTTTFLRRTLA
jgi:hypothetical protein